jgi:hypothetical protein
MSGSHYSAPRSIRIEVDKDHVLSRFQTFETPLEINGKQYTSIMQVFFSCCLAQHGMFSEGATLWEQNPQAQPKELEHLVDRYFEERNMKKAAYWILNISGVMLRIVSVLLENENDRFTRNLQSYHNQHGYHVTFVETTKSDTERLWSCGHKSNFVPDDPHEYAGANVYGDVLTLAYRNFVKGEDYDFPPLKEMLTRFVFQTHEYTKTALILSDSTFRHVSYVAGGDIWYQTGLTFGELASAVKQKFGNLMKFRFIVVAAGTTDSTKLRSREEWLESWNCMKDLLKPLRNHPYCVVVFNTGIGVPGWPKVPAYTDWFKDIFHRDFGSCGNFSLLDWSVPHAQNFFINPDGSANALNLDFDLRHPNNKGTRRMWHSIYRNVEGAGELRTVRLNTLKTNYFLPQIKDRDYLL